MPRHDVTTRPPETAAWQLAAWAAAVAALLVSFVHDWHVPLLGLDLRTWRGHVFVEAHESLKCVIAGGLLSGLWCRVAGLGRRLGIIALAVWAGAGFAEALSREVYWSGLTVWLVMLIVCLWRHRVACVDALIVFLRGKVAWNSCFLLLWWLVAMLCDASLLRDAPPGTLEMADAMLARALTHAVLACGGWLLFMAHDALAPRGVRWIGRLIVIAVPLLLLVNTWLRLWWGKGMIEMFGELEVGGRFELERAWAAGGVELTAGTVIGIAAVLLGSVGVYWLCSVVSRRIGWRMSPLRLVTVVAISWAALQIEQFTAVSLKERAWSWWERKMYPCRMTWVEPRAGLAGYDVAFHHPRPAVRAQTLASKPDVFLFLVESLRSDAVRPDIAPFLTRFRDEECQRVGESWAASNVTHQSWFSILSGELPVFMSEARERKQVALLPGVLKASGYRVESRMVNDFTYMDMLAANFGEPRAIDVAENVDRHNPENFFKVPEREVRMLNRLRASVESRPAGGLFAITGMDSTHYNYKWSMSFTPPFADFEANPIFPMRPNPDEVRRIRHRFWNSVAWVDSQLGAFCAWLKEKDRYDDALIIITGDHGEEFKEQGSWFHGTMLNDSQTRVPILIKWPRSLGVGRGPEVARASHLDLVPTVFDALGCERTLWQDLPGQSLLHPAAGERSIVMSTHFCGKNGEALVLKRGGTEAAFGWRNFWEAGVPSEMWLERVRGAEVGNWRDHFPDTGEKVFSRLDPR